MATNIAIVRTPSDRTRNRIVTIMRSAIADMDGVNFIERQDRRLIDIEHPAAFVPDFRLEWSEGMKHFRVYIYTVMEQGGKKDRAGYAICTIKNPTAAVQFVSMYQFLYKNRANVKSVTANAA